MSEEMFSETKRTYFHEHCWCQVVETPMFPQGSVTTSNGLIRHHQCCVCGDRKVSWMTALAAQGTGG